MLLYQNRGDGTLEDVTATSQLDWSGEAASAGEWIDYNHDGLLDYYLPMARGPMAKSSWTGRARAELAARRPFAH